MADAEFKNRFSWSKSRDSVFNECHREYYYTYYGYWGGWDFFADEQVKQLYVLKNLKNRYTWLGEIVHGSIKQIIKEVRNGLKPDLYTHLARLHQRIELEFNDSLNGLYKKRPKKILGLFEHEYGVPVSKGEWDEISDNAEECVTNFFNSDVFQYLQSINPSNYLMIEDFGTFDFEGTTIWVKLDLALKEGNNLLIFDWKTGKVRQVDMDVQLACYGLYCSEKFGYLPENILCKRYNVFLNTLDEFNINPELIFDVKDYMTKSISSMKNILADEENNTAHVDDFKVTPDDEICKHCHFKKVCSKWV